MQKTDGPPAERFEDPTGHWQRSKLKTIFIATIVAGVVYALILGLAIRKKMADPSTAMMRHILQNDLTQVEKDCELPAKLAGVSKGLFYAKSPEMVALLTQKGALIDVRDPRGCTPLYYAIYRCKPRVTNEFLKRGASVNVMDRGGVTPLHWACGCRVTDDTYLSDDPSIPRGIVTNDRDDCEIIQQLISSHANVEARDSSGNTPLFSAAWSVGATSALLAAGAKANVKDSSGYTPLHQAASREVVQMLLEAGADPDAKDWEGKSPRQNAQKTRELSDAFANWGKR